MTPRNAARSHAPGTYSFKLKSKARPQSVTPEAFEQIIRVADEAVECYVQANRSVIDQHIHEIVRCHTDAQARGFEPDVVHALYRAMHDLRGNAATFGFPLSGRVAASASQLVEHLPACPKRGPILKIIDQHVGALKAIVREGSAGHEGPTARRLAEDLSRLSRDVLKMAGHDADP